MDERQDRSRPYRALVGLGAMVFAAGTVWGQSESTAPGVMPLPAEDLFPPPLADPQEPRFGAAVLSAESDVRDTTVAAVALGDTIGLVRWPGTTSGSGAQLELLAGVFSQFDLEAPSSDLINSDYVVGFPLSYRRERFSARLLVYHQSSHLGDEFLIRQQPERVNLSFESAELLLGYDLGDWRTYGGGEYIFSRDPDDLQPAIYRLGIEYKASEPLVRVRGTGAGRLVFGTDVSAWEQHDWEPAWSVEAGIEFRPVGAEARAWRIVGQYFSGPSPYGQFFTEDLEYVGAALEFLL